MDGLFAWLIVFLIGYGIYRSGKKTGSRKGYGVGREHGRKGH